MNARVARLVGALSLAPGAPEELLRQVQAELGYTLPPEYLDFQRQSNGAEGDIGNSYLMLWPIEEVIPRNKELNVSEYAPGLLLFGSDGGGEAYAFDTRFDSMPVVQVPYIGLSLKYAWPRGQTFIDFLEYLYNQKI